MWRWQRKDWQIRFKGTGDEVISTFVKFGAGESVGVVFSRVTRAGMTEE